MCIARGQWFARASSIIAIVVVDAVVIAVLVVFCRRRRRRHCRRRLVNRLSILSAFITLNVDTATSCLRNVCECRISIATIFYYNICIYIYLYIYNIILPDRWELIKNKKKGEKRDRQFRLKQGAPCVRMLPPLGRADFVCAKQSSWR